MALDLSPEAIQRNIAENTRRDNLARQEAYRTIVSADDINTGVETVVKTYSPTIAAQAIDSVGLVDTSGNKIPGTQIVSDYQSYLKSQNEPLLTMSREAPVPGLPGTTFGEVEEAAAAQGKTVSPPMPIDPLDETELPGEREQDIIDREDDIIGDGNTERLPSSIESSELVPGLFGTTVGEVRQAAAEQGKPIPSLQLPENMQPMYAVQKALLTGASKEDVIDTFGEDAYRQAVSSIKKQAGQEVFVTPLKQKAAGKIFVEPELEKIGTAGGEEYERSQAYAAEMQKPLNRLVNADYDQLEKMYREQPEFVRMWGDPALYSGKKKEQLLETFRDWQIQRETQPSAARTLAYMTPGYGTYLTAKEEGIGSPSTIVSMLADALIFVPLIEGAAEGARSYGMASRAQRITSAASGAKAQLTSLPKTVDELSRGIKQSIIGTADYMRPGYIPISGLETSSGTVRIPIAAAGSAESAIIVRDLLMQKLISGEIPEIEYKGITYKLNRAYINAPSHATPSGSFLKEQSTVLTKVGMPESEQGLFVGSGVHSRFVPKSAFGKAGETGEVPAVALFGESAQQTVPTGKIYRGTAELERKYPVGTQLPELTTSGYSRTAQGIKFEVLSENEIPRLKKLAAKLLSPYHKIKSVYTPAIEIKGTKVPRVNLAKEASAYEREAIVAFEKGEEELARSLMAEAAAIRAERLTRPMTAGAARTLAAEFANYAAYTRTIASQASGDNYRTITEAADRLQGASDYLNSIAANSRLRTIYNNYVSLPTEDKILLSRSTQYQREVANVPQEFRIIDEPNYLRVRVPESSREYGIPSPRRTPELSTVTRTALPITDFSRPSYESPTRSVPETGPSSRVPAERVTRPQITGWATDESRTVIPVLPSIPDSQKKKLGIDDRGTVAWYQGKLNGQEIWYTFKYPYTSKEDLTRYIGVMPPGVVPVLPGDMASYRSIQLIAGTPPDRRTIDMGIQDILIKSPGALGQAGTISYTADIRQQTRSNVTVKNIKTIRTVRNGSPALAGVR